MLGDARIATGGTLAFAARVALLATTNTKEPCHARCPINYGVGTAADCRRLGVLLVSLLQTSYAKAADVVLGYNSKKKGIQVVYDKRVFIDVRCYERC